MAKTIRSYSSTLYFFNTVIFIGIQMQNVSKIPELLTSRPQTGSFECNIHNLDFYFENIFKGKSLFIS